MKMKFLYVRVSTTEQNTERQEQLKNTHKIDKVYIDKCSGKNTNRPQFQDMLKQLRQGDTIIVESYSRASRSTKDLLELVEILNKKQVNFVSIKENLDTSTPQGRLMLTMFAGLYQFERECMIERQKEGIEIAKQKGKYKNVGRKKLLPNKNMIDMLYPEWKSGKIKAKDFMIALGLEKMTFYRRIKEYEEQNNILPNIKLKDKKESVKRQLGTKKTLTEKLHYRFNQSSFCTDKQEQNYIDMILTDLKDTFEENEIERIFEWYTGFNFFTFIEHVKNKAKRQAV